MDDDRRRWDERYADGGLPGPAAPDRFDDFVDGLPTQGRALDIACGPGAQTLWAAGRGLHVDALDISPIAIDRLRAAASELGLEDRVDARTVDLDAGLPDHVTGPYDLVICQRFLARHLFGRVEELLAPGGLAVVTVLSTVEFDGEPGPFRARPGELVDTFGATGLGIRMAVEGAGQATVVLERPHDAASSTQSLLHPLVADAVARHGIEAEVVPCDPDAADTAAFCERYGYELDDSANTILVVGKSAEPAYAACVVLASTKLAVNSVVKRRLGTRKASFASGDVTLELTQMEIGGVTAPGLPDGLPLWIDAAVMERATVIIGGGNRSSKLLVAPDQLLRLPGAEVVDDLAVPAG